MKVGDIQPCNIFLNDEGLIKLTCHLTWPGQQTNYEKTLQNKKKTFVGNIYHNLAP